MSYDISTGWVIVLVIAVVWDIYWKYKALWKASRLNQRGWFIVLLLINSAGIIPLIYLYMQHPDNDGLGD